MMDIRTEVTGDTELIAKFGGMTDALRARLRDLMPQAGEEIRAAAAALAPRSPRRSSASKKYGPLASKIRARFQEKGDTFTESVSFGRAFYGMFQERGLDTMRRPRRQQGIVGVRLRHLRSGGVIASPRRGLLRRQAGASKPFRLPAHPFMGPAFTPRREAILARIRDAVVLAGSA